MPHPLPVQRRQAGAIQILVLIALLMSIFTMCLMIDLSRAAARRAELQVAVDAAALAAAKYLSNFPDAYASATTAAGQGSNTYDYRTGTGQQVKLPPATVLFGAAYDSASFVPAAAAAPGFKYVRIDSYLAPDEAYGKVDLLLMRMPFLTGFGSEAPKQITVRATAVAGPLYSAIGLRQ